jgi:alkanesulfonate monooxygenase SsuD/methylene tetrahydromethanopterin reductase-like flavin-dependent oxidoreductase (luciferase family)
MDHYWTERPDGRRGAHDPMVTLAYLAASTTEAELGTLVICNSFREPGQLGREALALADASAGRFILGMGAGWHQPEYDAFGIPFDHKVSRLTETLETLPRLMRGERVTYQGRYVRLNDATLVSTAAAPPLWLAAARAKMLDLTARYADGWNTAWHGEDTTAFRSRLQALRAAMEAAGRPAGEIEVSVGLLVLPDEKADSRGGMAVVGGPARVAEVLHAYGEAGADRVIVSLSYGPFTELDPSYPEKMAEALALL